MAAVPEGWEVRESIELARPDNRAYVVASAEFAAPGTTATEYAQSFGARLRDQLPGYQELSVEETVRSGEVAVLRRLRWTPAGAAPVAELHLYTVEDGRGVAVRASTQEAAFTELEPQLRAAVEGIRVRGAAPAGGVARRDGSARTRAYARLDAGQVVTTPAQAFGSADAAVRTEADWGEARQAWARTSLEP